MKALQLRRGRAVATCAVLAAMLGGYTLPWARASPYPALPAQAARSAGAKIFGKWCSDCHSTADGPGSVALQRLYQGKLPAILEQRTDLSPDYIKQAVRQGISFMPSFRKTEISDADLTLLADYLASAGKHTLSGNAVLKKTSGE